MSASVSKVRLAPAANATPDEKLTWEKELLGIYVTSHPFSFYEKAMGRVLTAIKDLPGMARKKWVVVGGVIDSTKKKITRAGAAMMFATIEDTSGRFELLVFPRTYESTKEVWVEGKIVCVVGRTSEEEGDDKLFVEKAYIMDKNNVKQLASQMAVNTGSPSVRQYVPVSAASPQNVPARVKREGVDIIVEPAEIKEKADAIKTILTKFPGTQKVFIVVGNRKIKTSYSVDVNKILVQELENLVGQGKIKI